MKIKVEAEKIIKAVKKLDGIEMVLENSDDAKEALNLILRKTELFETDNFGNAVMAFYADSSFHVSEGSGIGPYLFGFPALGVVGYLLSVVLGLWLVINILRQRNY